ERSQKKTIERSVATDAAASATVRPAWTTALGSGGGGDSTSFAASTSALTPADREAGRSPAAQSRALSISGGSPATVSWNWAMAAGTMTSAMATTTMKNAA